MKGMKSKDKKGKGFKRRLLVVIINIMVWVGAAVLYYAIFSLFFDTPIEHEVRKANDALSEQYDMLSSRYDSLDKVLTNVIDRDRNVYAMLFESEPPVKSLDTLGDRHDKLYALTNIELGNILYNRLEVLERNVISGTIASDTLESRMIGMGEEINNIPSIQPVVNDNLDRFAASFGMKIQPFFKTVAFHNGVDFALPEDSRIYATADGVVTKVVDGSKGEGLTVYLNHENGYKTSYSHINKSLVRKGSRVKRGDIIAYSGNSGLSFLPHLHYSVEYNGEMLDPIDFFYYELTPQTYRELEDLSQQLMQSLD